MDRRVTQPKRVTSPTWAPPPPCKKALTLKQPKPALTSHETGNEKEWNEFADLLLFRLSFCLSRDSLSCDTRSIIRPFYFIQAYIFILPPHSCALFTHFSLHQFFSYVYYHAKYLPYIMPRWHLPEGTPSIYTKGYRDWKSGKCFMTITFVSHVPGIPFCPCGPFSPCDPLSPRDPFSPFVEKSKVILMILHS